MKLFKKMMAIGLSLALCGSMLAPAFAQDTAKDNLGNALDKVIEDTVNDWSKNDKDDAADLNNGALDAIQPGNNNDNATAEDVQNAAKEDGDNVVTDVDNADQAAKDLKDSLENSVNNATRFEAVLDEDGNPVLDEDGNVVVREVTTEEGETDKGNLDTFVSDKADTVADATQKATETLDAIKAVVGEGEEPVSLTQEQYDDVMAKCDEVEANYNAAAAACAEANAAVAAAQATYDAAIAAAKEELGAEYANKSDAEVIAAYNAKITTANNNLAAAQEALDKTQEQLAALEDAKNLLKQYSDAMDALKAAVDPDGNIDPTKIAEILAGVTDAEDAKDVLEALKAKKDADGTNNALVGTAADYALADKTLQEKQAVLDELENMKDEDIRRDGAIKEMQDTYNTQVDLSGIKTTDDLYEAIGKAVSDAISEAKHKPVLKGRLELIQTHFNTIKLLEGKEALTETETQKLLDAKKALFGEWSDPADPASTDTRSLVKRVGGYPTFKDTTTAHDLMEVLDHMIYNQDTISKSQEAHQQKVDAAKTERDTAKETRDEINLQDALNNYLTDTGITADTAAETAKLMTTILAQAGGSYEDLQAIYSKYAQASEKKLADAQAELEAAKAAYQAAQALVAGKEGSNTVLDADELTGLLNSAKEKLEAAKENLGKAEEAKDAIDKVKDIVDVIVDPNPNPNPNPNPGGDDYFDFGDLTTIDDEAVPLAAGPVTRAEFIDYLWRHEGEPASAGVCTFTDVENTHEFFAALCWADENGVAEAYFDAQGHEDGTFEPDELVTVEAVRDILDNFAQVFGTNAVAADDLTTLTGEDDEAVLNCDEVLAEFFGEEYAPELDEAA